MRLEQKTKEGNGQKEGEREGGREEGREGGREGGTYLVQVGVEDLDALNGVLDGLGVKSDPVFHHLCGLYH